MTHPLTDKAVEAGARAIARLVPCGDGSRWMPNRGNGFPSEYSAVEQRLIRAIAKEAIEAALAAEGLCVVPREPTQAMLLAGLNVPQSDFLERCDNQTEVANVKIRPIYRAMIEAAREG